MPINETAWELWCLLETRWNVGAMGGLIGWAGWQEATQLLIHGHGVRGKELLAQTERLKMFEMAQLEIEAGKHELREMKANSRAPEGTQRVIGDVEDFFTDAVAADDETFTVE